jgi:ribosomal 30S subunit maturation factor RimM
VVVEPSRRAGRSVCVRPSRILGDSTGNVEVRSRSSIGQVEDSQPFKGGMIVKFESLADRNAARLLRGRLPAAPFEELEPLREDEVYLHDLIGIDSRPRDG